MLETKQNVREAWTTSNNQSNTTLFIVTNEKISSQMFFVELRVTVEEHPVLLTEAPLKLNQQTKDDTDNVRDVQCASIVRYTRQGARRDRF